jgi:hypothetical protein
VSTSELPQWEPPAQWTPDKENEPLPDPNTWEPPEVWLSQEMIQERFGPEYEMYSNGTEPE